MISSIPIELERDAQVKWWGLNPKSLDPATAIPMTKDDYKTIPHFAGDFTPLLFEVRNPLLLVMPPNASQREQLDNKLLDPSLKFKVTVITYLHQNRFWKPQLTEYELGNVNYMQVLYNGLERRDLPLVNLEVLFNVMFEMAMVKIGYDFTKTPHKPVNKATYKKYVEFVNQFTDNLKKSDSYDNDELEELGIYPTIATEKEMKDTILVAEYLHYVDFFKNSSPTVLMAKGNHFLLHDVNEWFDYRFRDFDAEGYEEKLAKIKKRAGVVRTRLTRIEKDLLVKLDTTGVAGGQLTSKAMEFYRHWLLAHTDKNRLYTVDWLVIQATGTKVKN